MSRPADCAAMGGPTISRVMGCVNDEMKECIACGDSCLWRDTEHPVWGFAASCPHGPVAASDTTKEPQS